MLGDVVGITDGNVAPFHWSLGRILNVCNVCSGHDKSVLIVKVRTQPGIYTNVNWCRDRLTKNHFDSICYLQTHIDPN